MLNIESNSSFPKSFPNTTSKLSNQASTSGTSKITQGLSQRLDKLSIADRQTLITNFSNLTHLLSHTSNQNIRFDIARFLMGKSKAHPGLRKLIPGYNDLIIDNNNPYVKPEIAKILGDLLRCNDLNTTAAKLDYLNTYLSDAHKGTDLNLITLTKEPSSGGRTKEQQAQTIKDIRLMFKNGAALVKDQNGCINSELMARLIKHPDPDLNQILTKMQLTTQHLRSENPHPLFWEHKLGEVTINCTVTPHGLKLNIKKNSWFALEEQLFSLDRQDRSSQQQLIETTQAIKEKKLGFYAERVDRKLKEYTFDKNKDFILVAYGSGQNKEKSIRRGNSEPLRKSILNTIQDEKEVPNEGITYIDGPTSILGQNFTKNVIMGVNHVFEALNKGKNVLNLIGHSRGAVEQIVINNITVACLKNNFNYENTLKELTNISNKPCPNELIGVIHNICRTYGYQNQTINRNPKIRMLLLDPVSANLTDEAAQIYNSKLLTFDNQLNPEAPRTDLIQVIGMNENRMFFDVHTFNLVSNDVNQLVILSADKHGRFTRTEQDTHNIINTFLKFSEADNELTQAQNNHGVLIPSHTKHTNRSQIYQAIENLR